MPRVLRMNKLLVAILLSCFAAAQPAGAVQLRVAAHLHSTYSQVGTMPLAALAKEAAAKKIDALIFSDHADALVEYGLWPLRDILKARISRASVLKAGPRNYLADINALRTAYPAMLFVPGVEATAYYRWSGSPFDRLVMHDWNRHMIIAGLEKPGDYFALPVIGNCGGASLVTIFFFLLVPAGFVLLRKGYNKVAFMFITLGVLGMAGAYPYREFRWSPYLDATPWEPYNRLIAYAEAKNALVFWAHPEAVNWREAQHLKGNVFAQTDTYPDCLEKAPDADGFAVFMEGYRQMALPGAEWDRALKAYLDGKRKKPVWAFAELDLVDFAATAIDSSYMLVDARERSVPALIDALKNGHFQPVANSASGRIEISTFTVACGGARAGQGETANCKTAPVVTAEISGANGASLAQVTLVRNGVAVLAQDLPLPGKIVFTGAPGSAFYRLMAEHVNSRAYSNPVFVKETR